MSETLVLLVSVLLLSIALSIPYVQAIIFRFLRRFGIRFNKSTESFLVLFVTSLIILISWMLLLP